MVDPNMRDLTMIVKTRRRLPLSEVMESRQTMGKIGTRLVLLTTMSRGVRPSPPAKDFLLRGLIRRDAHPHDTLCMDRGEYIQSCAHASLKSSNLASTQLRGAL